MGKEFTLTLSVFGTPHNYILDITSYLGRENELSLSGAAMQRLAEIYQRASALPDFGNGRFVRNILEKARMAQARRLLSMNIEKATREDVATILPEDIEELPLSEKVTSRLGFGD